MYQSASAPCSGRTSSWPTRNQRRHDAIAAFQNQVLTFMSEISVKFERIERNIEAMQPNDLMSAPPGLENVGSQQLSDGLIPHITDRLDVLEKVFVLTDWEQIEAASTSICYGPKHQEPEPEKSLPDTVSGCSAESNAGESSKPLSAMFDIFDAGIDAGVQVDFDDCDTRGVSLSQFSELFTATRNASAVDIVSDLRVQLLV